jgi:hypothetical protein
MEVKSGVCPLEDQNHHAQFLADLCAYGCLLHLSAHHHKDRAAKPKPAEAG